MTVTKQLYQLQLVDLEIESRKEALAKIATELAENDLVAAARGRLEADQARLGGLEKQQKDLELEAETLRAKIKEETAQADAGGMPPKELTALTADIASRTANLKTKDDALVELMGEIDKARERMQADTAEMADVEKKWDEEQAALNARQKKLNVELEELAEKREAAAAPISAEHLQLYKASRPERGATVVRVDRGRCSGCRISLSSSEVQRVRTGNIVRCSNCGRILFLE